MADFKKGDRVSFKPGPKAAGNVTGEVVGVTTATGGRGGSSYLVVKCDDGKERKARPGSCSPAGKKAA